MSSLLEALKVLRTKLKQIDGAIAHVDLKKQQALPSLKNDLETVIVSYLIFCLCFWEQFCSFMKILGNDPSKQNSSCYQYYKFAHFLAIFWDCFY